MKNTTYTQAQVNEAIYTVLTTQYKKQAPEAFNIVKASGYGYEKYDGRFVVYSEQTKRRISLTEGGWWGNYHIKITHGWYNNHITMYRQREGEELNALRDRAKNFDFVGCLDKPINRTWYDMQREPVNKALSQYEVLKSERWDVKYHTDKIEAIQKQMEELQKSLVYHAQEKAKAEASLKAKRAELNLA